MAIGVLLILLGVLLIIANPLLGLIPGLLLIVTGMVTGLLAFLGRGVGGFFGAGRRRRD